MAEPRNPSFPNAPVVDEQAQAKAMAATAEVAAGMPQINPVTGELPGLFTGLFGITDILINDPIYGEEIKKIKAAIDAGNQTLATTLIKKSKWSQLNEDAQNAYLLKLKNSKLYKERLTSWLINIKRQLAAKGIKADDATLEKYYVDGIDDETIIDELVGTITPTAAKGETSTSLNQLRTIARSNGFDLERDFGTQLSDWLQRIARGESIDDFASIIRESASERVENGYVKNLLRGGFNLNSIYSSYINLMAQAFDVDPEDIDENDPLLQKAFTDKGGIKFNEFQKLIRADERYKQTPNQFADLDYRETIRRMAIEEGVSDLSDSDIDEITNTAISLGVSPNSNTVKKLIQSKLSYSPGKITRGAAGNNLAELRASATANGLDLDTSFGSSIQEWLRNIAEGESIDTYKRIIRQTAKLGLPEKVGSLLDSGVDLDTIYSPYRNAMASILEINPQTITLSNPTLRSAITPTGEMSIYEYQRALRKDPRWQYTNNAREDASNVALQVLRDFGFQG